MEFEWDDQKNNINIEKHGIDFNFAKEIFSGVWISKPDNRRDYGEERLIALGLLGEFVLAEAGGADVLLTTDDRLLRKAQQYRDSINVTVGNPLIWLMATLQEDGNEIS
ncbi:MULTISPECIES: BrnT family toxin [unclassified Microcystis]|uniref:BrnT family toxin n=1 Tax=unclassified Microcystis TaxID=2643300 RepID=UPI00257B122B|nr:MULTISPECIES: BrnT family toxin [unclassified Microcystis]